MVSLNSLFTILFCQQSWVLYFSWQDSENGRLFSLHEQIDHKVQLACSISWNFSIYYFCLLLFLLQQLLVSATLITKEITKESGIPRIKSKAIEMATHTLCIIVVSSAIVLICSVLYVTLLFNKLVQEKILFLYLCGQDCPMSLSHIFLQFNSRPCLQVDFIEQELQHSEQSIILVNFHLHHYKPSLKLFNANWKL